MDEQQLIALARKHKIEISTRTIGINCLTLEKLASFVNELQGADPADPIPWANSPQWVLGFKAGLKHQHETPTALLAAGLGYAELHESIQAIAFQTGTEPIDIIDWLNKGGLAKMFLAHFEKPIYTKT